ncbi:metallophosphoesterase, partial [Romboutsia sp.]|uniref:metallophosphoesterase n=1 Tax=Romboutsia sp. TaxID=1965302 RepID=UPI003F39DAD6
MNILKISFVLVITSLLITFACFGKEKETINYKFDTNNDLSMYIATDIHYLSNKLTDNKGAFDKYVTFGDGKQLFYINEIFDALTNTIKNKKPNILILSGDLTNNGELESHKDLTKKLSSMEESGTQVYVIPGNHDISNPWARKFIEDKQYITDSISENEFRSMYSNFGFDNAVLEDEDSLSYLATPSEDVWLLMLDTNNYKTNTNLGYPQMKGSLSKSTLSWINKCISLANEHGAKIIPVMHHSIMNHNDVYNDGYTLNDNNKLIEVFNENNIDFVLSGHIHIQNIAVNKSNDNNLYDIATGSLAVYPHNFGQLNYSTSDDKFIYQSSRLNISDKVLNNFDEYSREFFGNSIYNRYYNKLSKYGNLSKENID